MTVTVTKNVEYTVKVEKGVIVSGGYRGEDGGTVTVNGIDAPYTVPKNSTVTLSVREKTGYSFTGWYIGNTLYSTDKNAALAVGETDLAVEAAFEYIDYTIEINADNYAGETSRGGVVINNPKVVYHITDTVSFTPTAAAGYVFGGYYLYIPSEGEYGRLATSPNTVFSLIDLVMFVGGTDTHLSFLAGFVPTGSAQESYRYEVISGQEVRITGVDAPFSSPIVFIPSELNGYTVTSISQDAFYGHAEITKIYLPATLSAFYGVSNPFIGCPNITAFVVSSGNKSFSTDTDGILYNKTKDKLIAYPNGKTQTAFTVPNTVRTVGRSAFEGNRYLISITAANVSSIGIYAFRGMRALEEFSLTSALIRFELSAYAFAGSTALRTVTVNLTSITGGNAEVGGWAFEGCTALTAVELKGVVSLGAELFKGCTLLTAFTLDQKTESLNGDVFGKSSIENLYADPLSAYFESENGVLYNKSGKLVRSPEKKGGTVAVRNGTIEIGANAFSNSTATQIDLVNTVTAIGESAFRNGVFLNFVYFGTGLKTVGNYAFFGCVSLTAISLADGTEDIGESAFENCTALASVYFGLNLKTLQSSSFSNCSSLTAIDIPGTVTDLGDKLKSGSFGMKAIFVGCTSLSEIRVAAVANAGNRNNAYQSIDGIVYAGDYKADIFIAQLLIRCPEGRQGVVTVTGGELTAVGNYGFYRSRAASVIFQSTAKLVAFGIGAFSYGALTSIVLPQNLDRMLEDAFLNCKSLVSVSFESSKLSKLSRFAFAGCNLSSITLPETMSEIQAYAFADNVNLTSVYVRAKTPPTMVNMSGFTAVFDGHAPTFKIYIEKQNGVSNVQAYKSANGWKDYRDYIFDAV
jgi:hypothetical protein